MRYRVETYISVAGLETSLESFANAGWTVNTIFVHQNVIVAVLEQEWTR